MKKVLVLVVVLCFVFSFYLSLPKITFAADAQHYSTKYGDLNADNYVNSTDYILFKKFLLITDFDLAIANGLQITDLNKDGAINSSDYALLKKYVLGLIDSFPADNVPIKAPEPTKSPIYAKPPESSISLNIPVNSLIGKTKSDIIKIFGSPDRKELSKYGFYWYIYNSDYSKYIQVGIQNEEVVGVYSNSDNYRFFDRIQVGTDKAAMSTILGKPLQYILKGTTRYMLDSTGGYEVFNVDNSYYATIFYDKLNENRVTSTLIIKKETEHSLNGYYGKPSEVLMRSYERQMFEISNAIRVRNGKQPYIWNDSLVQLTRKHSSDMAMNNYFSHTNLDGKNPTTRMREAGISFSSSSENIAKGYFCGIYAIEGFMSTSSHRKNILGSYTSTGNGVYIGEGKNIYYTQDFCALR